MVTGKRFFFINVKIAVAGLQEKLSVETREDGLARVLKEPYHLRVCIPCYKEPLELLQQTVLGSLGAAMPRGCRRTIYLCDDGKDPLKREW
jgi:endoglucanase